MTVQPALAQWLLTGLVLAPAAGAAAVALLGRAPRTAAWVAVATAAATLAAAALLVAADAVVAVRIPALTGALALRVDAAGRLFALVAAAVWFFAALHSVGYLRGDPNAGRLRVASLVVLGANLGVFVAGDWITLLVFFELFGLAGLLFVVHAGTAEARAATIKYFWMTLLGGVFLLAGVALLVQAGGGAALAALPDSAPARWAVALMMVGFGVKAGMMGLHVWLPDAHSVAPAPASAVLSGVMIKAGAYGIFRSLGALPESAAADFGLAVLVLGLVGMVVGAVAALAQRHAKRLLAWSSVSQMGFILAALGAAAMLGIDGGAGRAAALMHVVNHALFKGALFLAVGALVHAAGTADLGRLGGAAGRAPWLAAALLVAVAGIVGLPPFNGFVSKTMIHHALADLQALHGGFAVAEWTYYVASVGTAAMFVRLVHALFRPAPSDAPSIGGIAATMTIAVALPALAVIAAGVFGGALVDGLVAPALLAGPGALPEAALPHGFHAGPVDHLSALAILAVGAAAAHAADRARLADRRLPPWMTVDGAYRALGRTVVAGAQSASRTAAGIRRSAQAVAGRRVRAARRVLGVNWTDFARVGKLAEAMRMPRDSRYRTLDEQRDRIVAEALARARERCSAGDRLEAERLLDATRHYAGWLGTRLLHAGVDLAQDADVDLASSAALRARLADSAVDMAESDLEAGREAHALAIGDAALESCVGAPVAAPPAEPERSWLRELRSVAFHLLTDPARRHWPVSENFAHGAFASELRQRLHRLARDPGAGLALASAVLVLVFVLLTVG